jgi:hypothetical protein
MGPRELAPFETSPLGRGFLWPDVKVALNTRDRHRPAPKVSAAFVWPSIAFASRLRLGECGRGTQSKCEFWDSWRLASR